MLAAVYHTNSDVRIEEIPRPEPGEGEILIRIRASGICGSDLMEWYRVPRAPLVLGHEVAGEVVETGLGGEPVPGGRQGRGHPSRSLQGLPLLPYRKAYQLSHDKEIGL